MNPSHSPAVSGQPTSTLMRRLKVLMVRLSSLPLRLITASKLRMRTCLPTLLGVICQSHFQVGVGQFGQGAGLDNGWEFVVGHFWTLSYRSCGKFTNVPQAAIQLLLNA
jgi:hypothetical protein